VPVLVSAGTSAASRLSSHSRDLFCYSCKYKITAAHAFSSSHTMLDSSRKSAAIDWLAASAFSEPYL
jgi:hypothetical protein